MRSIRHRAFSLAVVASLLAVACETTQLVDPDTGEPIWVTVSPQTALLRAIGASVQLTVLNAMGSPVTVVGITWRVLDPNIIEIDGSGRVTAVAPGTARIVVETDTKSDTVSIEVRQDVAAVSVSPSDAAIMVGATQQLTASLSDPRGHAVAGREITWSSSAPTVAEVSSQGVVTGRAAGPAVISAQSEGRSATMNVVVSVEPPVPVATVTVEPGSTTLTVGQTQQLTATLRAAGGAILTGRAISWTSSASGIASVSGTGLVTAQGAGGPVTITATSESRSGTASFTINAAVVTRALTVDAVSGNTGSGTVTGGGLTCSISGTSESGTCTQQQADGAVVTLTATPTTGNDFGGWGGACSGTGNCIVTMSQARNVTVRFTQQSGTTSTLYVSPTGSDANPGTAAAPFRTIQRAADLVNPGDVVIVEDGTWTDTDGDGSVFAIDRGGTASAYVTFRSRNKWGAKLDGQNGAAAQGIDFNNGVGYVRIEGFEIFGVANVGSPSTGRGSASGIDMYDGGHHSFIVGNHIHHIGNVCTLSTNTNGQVGIFVQQPDITVENNLIHDIGRFFPGENGCSYTGFTGYMTLDHGMYLNGGGPGADRTLIRNNIFYNTRHGWAVQMYPGSLENIQVLNNTFAFGNPNKNYTSIVLDANISNGSTIANNIFFNPEGGKSIEAAGFAGTITISNNITMGSAIHDRSSTPSGMTLANNQLATNALFVNAAGFDFRLQSTSPAIDAGLTLTLVTIDFDGRARPRGARHDIGAWEF